MDEDSQVNTGEEWNNGKGPRMLAPVIKSILILYIQEEWLIREPGSFMSYTFYVVSMHTLQFLINWLND